ncbi:MAG TPA: DNA repair protein RadA [Patescibacteria group bacterium]|jgi:DNA repair protein RadA/Sms|nr:DNA repair protein RadA [Patescibacteria group bacterium]
MAKIKQSYVCNNCNYITPKWLGKCPECNEWNSLVVSIEQSSAITSFKSYGQPAAQATNTYALDDIVISNHERLLTGIDEWDRVMGGGIMSSSLIILTGDPGIGKSTLLLTISQKLQINYAVLYVSTEESLAQVKQRAERLQAKFTKNIKFCDIASFDAIVATAQQLRPLILIIDSIQNCYIEGSTSVPGSIGQLREATFRLMRLAKEQNITIILTGHINKEGLIAGPKTMEHMVDAVFYLQGEDQWQTRILRSVKNRFGTINELGFFEMGAKGLQEVANINEHLIHDLTHAAGSALVAISEGSKPLLVELQALTVPSKMNMPQRVIAGVDHKQVMLIAAILEKYLKIKLSMQDIFFKISAAVRMRDHGIDLGIASALLSSYMQQPLPEKSLVIGNIGLTGHIKPVHNANMLVKEAERFGIKNLLIAKNQKIPKTTCTITQFSSIYELLSLFSS